MMRRLAFLSTDHLEGFFSYDELAAEALRERGCRVDTVSWRQAANWSDYEMVVIRTPWDYQQAPQQFLNVLATIENSGTALLNNLQLVRWNIAKTYLQELADSGFPIVPTIWLKRSPVEADFSRAFETFGCGELIIKPQVSANADFTYRVTRTALPGLLPELAKVFQNRPAMLQPFLDTINTIGEYSLIYFDDEFSHAIRKVPKTGDFRVQEEHGGLITAAEPPTILHQWSTKILHSLPMLPLYARFDWVFIDRNRPALIELELIEPSLYFNMDSQSAHRFAEKVLKRLTASS
jgi:glutathione synthase/RimK-type ligase-like ATP-grasp enzyme